MRQALTKLGLLTLVVAVPAGAQSVGMQIVDTTGAPVGTVTALNGNNLQVKTDKHEVMLPRSSFSLGNGKLHFAMTQAQLNAEIEKSVAAAAASITAGATVKGLQGTEIGKIDSVTDTDVVIALTSGSKIQVARMGVRGNADGTVTVGLTADQLKATAGPEKAASGQ